MKRRYARKKLTVGKVKKIVKKELDKDSEFKVREYSHNSSPGQTASVNLITGISQGNSTTTRVGNKIMVRSIRSNLRIHADPAGASITGFRLVIIADREGNGVLPTPAEIFEDTASGALNFLSLPNLINKKRFWVMYNRMFTLHLNGEGSHLVQFYRRFKNGLPLNYGGINNTQADTRENHIYFVYISSETADLPSIQGFTRIRYTDN